jgi:phosphate transport system substrate-binding protein
VTLSAAFASTLALAACGASNEGGSSSASGDAGESQEQLSGTLNGAGSSAQQAAMQGWTVGYNAMQPGVTVNYDPVGSGGGREQFLSGGVAFAGSDAALTDDELTTAQERCGTDGVFELPDYISAIAVVYNLPGVEDLKLTPDVLAKIFTGAITTWDDPAIAADNEGADLPSTTITPVHRADDSGTTKNFTDYMAQAAPSVWTEKADGKWPLSGGEAANQTSGMISAVQAGEGAIGYADESQAGDLGVAQIGVGSEFVKPSADAAAAVVENSELVSGRGQYDFAYKINRTTTSADEYPIVLVSYHIGCVNNDDAAQAELLKGFLGYVISEEGQQAGASAAGSAPLSDKLREQAKTAVDAITSGS